MINRKRYILLLVPSFVGILTFYVIPFIMTVYYAFTKNVVSGEFVGVDNFINVLTNKYFRLALANTMKFTAVAVPLNIIISLILALLMVYVIPRLPFVKNALFLPYILPSITIVSIWNAYLSNFKPFESLILLYLWKYSGLIIMLMLAALYTIPKEVTDAAMIDGASLFMRIIYVYVPYIMPTILFSVILSMSNAFKIFRESYLLYGSYPDDEVYMLQNYLYNHFEKLNYQNISTAAIYFAFILYAVIAVAFFCEKKWSEKIW